jgi:acetyl/propionyl-CoA carboxylase alpha subunit
MVLVESDGDVTTAFDQARREAQAAFGDGRLYLERFLTRARHVEVQVLADQHGHIVHLGERDCSAQRRYQKLVEEAPATAVPEAVRGELHEAAVALARALNYVGAGTVEFIVDAQSGEYAFLEVNTRVQVEHPVTEMVTGVDIVRAQLQIAGGLPLGFRQSDIAMQGHAVEARVNAEDPARGFAPAPGVLTRWVEPAASWLRIDTHCFGGYRIPPYYDSLLAKVIAYGETRDEARRRLSSALRRARIHGVTTNRDLLVAVLDHDEFAAGRIDTHFLDRHPPASLCPPPATTSTLVRQAAAAAALSEQATARQTARVWAEAPSGWRNNPGAPRSRRYRYGDAVVEVRYRRERDGWWVEVDGQRSDLAVSRAAPGLVELVEAGVRRRFSVAGAGERLWVDGPGGSVELRREERFRAAGTRVAAGSLVAPMPGIVRRVAVGVGDQVRVGAELVVLEAMKMEHTVLAPVAGTVRSLPVAEGRSVDAGTTLVVMDADDPVGAGSGEVRDG